MRCKEIEAWSFSELVGAFLDLAITYLLLCACALSFLASKFLDLFGLCLPCPCNGLFSDPNRNKCWQRMLVECPSKNVSSIQASVLSRAPFDSIWDKNSDSESFVSAVNETGLDNEAVALEGEAFQERNREMGVGDGVIDGRDVKERRSDSKLKRAWSQKERNLRYIQNGAADNGRLSSSSSYDLLQKDVAELYQSPASVTKMANKIGEGSTVPDGGESSLDIGFPGRDSESFVSDEPADENESIKEIELTDVDWKYNVQERLCYDGDEKNAIRILENALEQEQAARTALYLELEKERSAAASAADEAMAMILRLQEEKSLIEMEARQYQRMKEEKSAYDLEEMSILKEILLRREKEKHFLEVEVEAYRKMIFQNELLDSSNVQEIGTMNGERISPSLYAGQDTALMLQRFHGSIYCNERHENTSDSSVCELRLAKSEKHSIAFGKELPIPESDEVKFSQQGWSDRHTSIDKLHEHMSSCSQEIKEGFQEQESVLPECSPVGQELKVLDSFSQFKLSTEACEVQERSTAIAEKELLMNTSETGDQAKTIFAYNVDDSGRNGKSSHTAVSDTSPCVHDVHVIDDKTPVSSEVEENGSEKQSINAATLDIPRTCDSPNVSMQETKLDISRSCSDMTRGLPPLPHPQSKSLVSDLRRNSMSMVDFERFKIDSEVGWLRERLKTVQEGREKLNISSRHKEKDNIQLQLLDNIVSQLREIRQLTEPGKVSGLVSLPPPATKGRSKNRNWRSVSLGVHRSS
ncbi:hypothetical protein Tsubulata_003031 [Turnera subulata]|uniref:GTD-binding domain-containing protein n=1 Tax=Turnera subulata TaxID=218843 RepID=A0A9Q0G3N7_9ROSI|nr:hypothetical protein Tsubulata_003031 [Turnera subulata]